MSEQTPLTTDQKLDAIMEQLEVLTPMKEELGELKSHMDTRFDELKKDVKSGFEASYKLMDELDGKTRAKIVKLAKHCGVENPAEYGQRSII